MEDKLEIFIDGMVIDKISLKPANEITGNDVKIAQEKLIRLRWRRVSPNLMQQVEKCIGTCYEFLSYKSKRKDERILNELAHEQRALARAFKKEAELHAPKAKKESAEKEMQDIMEELEYFERRRVAMNYQVVEMKDRMESMSHELNLGRNIIKEFEETRYLLTYGDYFGEMCTKYRTLDKDQAFEEFWTNTQEKIVAEKFELKRQWMRPSLPKEPTPVLDAIKNVATTMRYSSVFILFDIKQYTKRNKIAHVSSIRELVKRKDWIGLANQLYRDQAYVYELVRDKDLAEKIWMIIEAYKNLMFDRFEPGDVNQQTGIYPFKKLVVKGDAEKAFLEEKEKLRLEEKRKVKLKKNV